MNYEVRNRMENGFEIWRGDLKLSKVTIISKKKIAIMDAPFDNQRLISFWTKSEIKSFTRLFPETSPNGEIFRLIAKELRWKNERKVKNGKH